MNKKEYMEFHANCCQKMIDITKRKNADYTGVGDDPFRNFRQVEAMGICSVEQGFLTRISDKLSRINSFMQKGFFEVADESIEDTLLDAANYMVLMSGYIKSKKYSAKETPPPIPTQRTLDSVTAEDLRALDLRMIKLSQMPKAPTTLGQKKSFRE